MRNTIIYFEDLTGKCPVAQIGLKEIINLREYSVVDNESNKIELLENNINLSTTHVTYMRDLFNNNATFNLHISFLNTSSLIKIYQNGILKRYLKNPRISQKDQLYLRLINLFGQLSFIEK